MECDDYRVILSENVGSPMIPLGTPGYNYAEGNMDKLSPTIPINISRTPRKIENVYVGADCSPNEIDAYTKLFKEFRDVFAWSYDEMPCIDPHIVEHEIKTYLDARPIRQLLRAMNPRKEPAIKEEIEKLLKDGFIYPVPLIEWVSNPVPVDKKQGTIHVCTDLRELK